MGITISLAGTYPGMLPAEVEIFRRWALRHETEYDRFDFNVRVGRGADPGPTFDDAVRRNAVANSQKRIDAVGYKNGRATIIEVKDRAGASALGELMTYAVLYRLGHPGAIGTLMLLVTNSLQPDMDTVLKFYGIPWELVPSP